MSGVDVTTYETMYNDLIGNMDGIREWLDSISDTKSSHRRGITSSLVSDTEPLWKGFADKVAENFRQITDPKELAGIFLGVQRALDKEFSKKVDEFVDQLVKDQGETTPTEKPSDDAIKEKQSEYSAQYQLAKSLRAVLRSLAPDNEYPEPKKLTGSRGARGPRNYTLYTWTIRGEEVKQDSPLLWMSKQYNYASQKALRDAIKSVQVGTDDDGNPVYQTFDQPEIHFTFNNGDELVGTRDVVHEGTEVVDPDNEEDDEDDE